MLRYLQHTCVVLIALLAAGCSGNGPEAVPVAGDAVVNLCIAVSTHDSQPLNSVSRSVPNDTVYFEPSVTDYELMSTLRVIIANNGTVEFNEFFGPLDKEVYKVTDIVFTTKVFGKRDIYLIANEASVPSSAFDFNIMPGEKVDPSITDIKLVTSAAGTPLIDNTGDEKRHIPMAEHFEVEIKAPPVDLEGDYWQYANLFVTRAASKFSFSAKAVEAPLQGNSYHITKVIFNSIGNSEFLFPNNTLYSPDKYIYAVSDKPLNVPCRIIEEYAVPAEAANASVEFGIPDDKLVFNSTSNEAQVYSPELYFPETMLNGDYTVTFVVDFAGSQDYDRDGNLLPSTREFTAKLPNLPSLPRNTHVVIKAEFDSQSLNAVVDLVPYIGVELEPVFGFDELYPKPSTK